MDNLIRINQGLIELKDKGIFIMTILKSKMEANPKLFSNVEFNHAELSFVIGGIKYILKLRAMPSELIRKITGYLTLYLPYEKDGKPCLFESISYPYDVFGNIFINELGVDISDFYQIFSNQIASTYGENEQPIFID